MKVCSGNLNIKSKFGEYVKKYASLALICVVCLLSSGYQAVCEDCSFIMPSPSLDVMFHGDRLLLSLSVVLMNRHYITCSA